MKTKAPLEVTILVLRSDPPRRGVCRGCKASVEWVATPKGKHMPIDWPLHPVATFERLDGTLVTQIDARQSHFVNCPQAAEFRKRP